MSMPRFPPRRATAETSAPKINCIACRQPIPAGASICSVCKSYQANWRNWFQYLSGLAALIALTATAVIWIVGNGRATLVPNEDVGIVSASTLTETVIANRGDKEVFLGRMSFYMLGRVRDWIAPTIEINERLSPGQFVTRLYKGVKPNEQSRSFVKGLSPERLEAAIVKAANDDPCYELVFFEKSDHTLQQISKMVGSTLNTFPVAGTLVYWTTGSKAPRSIDFVGSGLVRVCAAGVPAP